jgi:hypothetical protein
VPGQDLRGRDPKAAQDCGGQGPARSLRQRGAAAAKETTRDRRPRQPGRPLRLRERMGTTGSQHDDVAPLHEPAARVTYAPDHVGAGAEALSMLQDRTASQHVERQVHERRAQLSNPQARGDHLELLVAQRLEAVRRRREGAAARLARDGDSHEQRHRGRVVLARERLEHARRVHLARAAPVERDGRSILPRKSALLTQTGRRKPCARGSMPSRRR